MTTSLYLRRFSKRSQFQAGVVFGSLFLCRDNENGLSYHKKPSDWGESDMAEYQERNSLKSGDRPGVIEVAGTCFSSLSLAEPALTDSGEEDYYRVIHCESRCLTEAEAAGFAEVVTTSFQYGQSRLARDLVRANR